MKDNLEQFHRISGDPYAVLKLLDATLGRDGNLVDAKDIMYILELMEEAKMLTDRCMFVNILRATRNRTILLKFAEDGGWDTLYKWLQEARLETNKPFLLELLKLYKQLPVTVTLLKQNNCAKDIRQLSKSSDDSIEALSHEIVDVWMLMVKENSAELIRKGEKPKSSVSLKGTTADENNSNAGSNNSHSTATSAARDVRTSSTEKKVATDNDSVTSAVPVSNSDATNEHTNSSSNKNTENRPKTVKVLGSKMRSTGLELDTGPPTTKKKTASDVHNHNSSSGSSVIRKHALPSSVGKDVPGSSVAASLTIASTDASSSLSSSPSAEQKAKVIKPPPPKPKVPEKIFESSGFMEAISHTDYSVGRRKRKLSISSGTAATAAKPASSAAGPVSLDDKKTVPPVFYRDTLLSPGVSKDGVAKTLAAADGTTTDTAEASERIPDNEAGAVKDISYAVTGEVSDKSADGETVKLEDKVALSDVAEPAPKKKKAKSVTWAEESKLCTISYFQLDENERVNVNKMGDFAEVRRHEQERERQTMMNVKRQHSDAMLIKHQWHKPRLITGLAVSTSVCNSSEKKTQLEREQGVLQVLYFAKNMIPDSPAEPEVEYVEIQDPKVIPLNDESGTGDASYEEYVPAPASSAGSLPPPGTTVGNMYNSPLDAEVMMGSNPMDSIYHPPPIMSQGMDTSDMNNPNMGPYPPHPGLFNDPGMSMGPNVHAMFPPPGPMMRPPLLGHGPSMPPFSVPPRGPSRGMHSRYMGNQPVCQHFLSGNCRYGDKCRLLHQLGPGYPY